MVKKQGKAIVVFSGGQDSTTCLLWAQQRFEEVIAVSFDYGQRHILELEVAKEIAKDFGVEHRVLDLNLLNQLAPTALTRDDIAVTTDAVEGDEIPNTFVPGRNHLFLSFVAVMAHVMKAKYIITGVSEADFSNYPDCRNEFIESLEKTVNLALGSNDLQILTPLMYLDKSQVWQLADELGHLDYVYQTTLTCYNGIVGEGCKQCPACQLRAEGYAKYAKTRFQDLNQLGARTGRIRAAQANTQGGN